MISILNNFFSKEFELEINKKMMYRNYKFELDIVLSYVKNILSIDFDDFIQYTINNYDVYYLTSEDILQFSNFEDATINICKLFKSLGDNGYRFLEIGKFLQNDGKERKDMANRKYGENHSKTGENIGLLYKIDYTYYLSCFGYILDYLTSDEIDNLICRLILRNKLIRRLLYRSYTAGIAYYIEECGFLNNSTIVRRKSNTKKLINKINSKTKKFKQYIKNIVF